MIRGENFALSNLCWPATEDRTAMRIIRALGYRGIELAPFKVFGGWDAVSRSDIANYAGIVASEGLTVVALQGILFGAKLEPIFSGADARTALVKHARHVAWMAGEFGGLRCVFGAPSLRKRLGLSATEADRLAIPLFRELGKIFEAHGSVLVLEANPERYGCDYVTTTDEAVSLVAEVGHLGFQLHIDTGAICINRESSEALESHVGSAAHFHVSEPDLAPLSFANAYHTRFGDILRSSSYAGWVSVEMKQPEGDWRDCLHRSTRVIEAHYDV